MKAISIKPPAGLDSLSLIDVPMPQPKADEVLVRWRASSLNYHDLLVANGSIPVPEGRVPMSDGAGVVETLGEGVERWRVGDQVMSLFFPNWIDGRASPEFTQAISGETAEGFACEYSCVKASSLTSIPQGYTFAEAATLPCAAVTAWRALVEEGNLKSGDKVLVQGSGGMSIFALQIAKAAGAYVYATTSSNDKAQRLEALGADKVVSYVDDPKWGKTIFKDSGGGVDHVLDVGGPTTLSQSVEAIGFAGQITLIGILGGRSAEFVLPKLFFKHASMQGIAVGSRRTQEDMVKAINVSQFKPVIDSRYSLADLGQAFKHQESGKHFGKIVVEF